jgi:hypothetical protein
MVRGEIAGGENIDENGETVEVDLVLVGVRIANAVGVPAVGSSDWAT